MTIDTAVRGAVEKHDFQHISDLSRKEFVEMMTEILENAYKSNDFKTAVWDILPNKQALAEVIPPLLL